MPYANNKEVEIYYEVEGNGPPLVLASGSPGRIEGWRERGYTEALRKDFQLVLFNARSYGRSDKPHSPDAYGLNMADDVVAVLDDIGIDQVHYFGYSMGAQVGFWLASRYAERFLSFIFMSMSPYPETEAVARTRETGLQNLKVLLADPQAYLLILEQQLGHPLSPIEKAETLARDAEAEIARILATRNAPPLNDCELSNISVPCLLVCGDLERFHAGAKEAASHIPHSRFVSLPGLDHGSAFQRSDLVLPHVKKFLAEMRAGQI